MDYCYKLFFIDSLLHCSFLCWINDFHWPLRILSVSVLLIILLFNSSLSYYSNFRPLHCSFVLLINNFHWLCSLHFYGIPQFKITDLNNIEIDCYEESMSTWKYREWLKFSLNTFCWKYSERLSNFFNKNLRSRDEFFKHFFLQEND